MAEVDDRRARSFDDVAEAYRRARPAYPAAAVAWVLESAPGRRVVDLAAGTGKLTEVPVAAGADVVAVEPLDRMRAALQQTVPGVPALAGTAEQIPLPDASADALFVAQAFHWFDPPRALDEIARVPRSRRRGRPALEPARRSGGVGGRADTRPRRRRRRAVGIVRTG